MCLYFDMQVTYKEQIYKLSPKTFNFNIWQGNSYYIISLILSCLEFVTSSVGKFEIQYKTKMNI